MVDMLSNAMKNEPAICTCYKGDTRMGHVQPERLPKCKIASREFTFVRMCCVLEMSLMINFAVDLSLQIFNNH